MFPEVEAPWFADDGLVIVQSGLFVGKSLMPWTMDFYLGFLGDNKLLDSIDLPVFQNNILHELETVTQEARTHGPIQM